MMETAFQIFRYLIRLEKLQASSKNVQKVHFDAWKQTLINLSDVNVIQVFEPKCHFLSNARCGTFRSTRL